MNHDEHDDQLWELLRKAPPRKARPAFVQGVLRAVRLSEPEPTRELGFFEWLRQGWNGLAFVGAASLVLLFVTLGTQSPREPAGPSQMVAAVDPAAIDAALQSKDFAALSNNLDLLIAFDNSNAWLDSSRP